MGDGLEDYAIACWLWRVGSNRRRLVMAHTRTCRLARIGGQYLQQAECYSPRGEHLDLL
jgi:hypothetical protein